MKTIQIESCQAIANYYGARSQLMMAIEEMSELTKEICKYERFKGNESKLIDEIADVKIMVEQLEYILGVNKEVDSRITYKLERQLRRMEQERE